MVEDEVAEGVGQLRPRTAFDHDGPLPDRVHHLIAHQPVERDAGLLEQDREPERRHRQEQEGEEREAVVEPGVLLHRAQHPDHHRQQQRQQHRQGDQPERDTDPGGDLVADVDVGAHGGSEVAGRDAGDPGPVALHQWFVEVQALLLAADHLCRRRRVAPLQVGERVAGERDEQEHDERRRQDDRHGDNEATDRVREHGGATGRPEPRRTRAARSARGPASRSRRCSARSRRSAGRETARACCGSRPCRRCATGTGRRRGW